MCAAKRNRVDPFPDGARGEFMLLSRGRSTCLLSNIVGVIPTSFLLFACSAAMVGQTAPDPTTTSASQYSFTRASEDYLKTTFSPEDLISNLADSAGGAALHSVLHDFTTPDFQRALALGMTRRELERSISFVTASLLREDTRFVPSGEHAFRARVRYAFLQTFLDRGRNGSEIAAPRIAAAFGTAWVLDTWHPWMGKKEPNPWTHAGFLFSAYAARSFWTEFKPDVKHQVQMFLKRNHASNEP